MNPLANFVVTKGKGKKEKVLVLSGTRDVTNAEGKVVGTVQTAFKEFSGSPAEIEAILRGIAESNKARKKK